MRGDRTSSRELVRQELEHSSQTLLSGRGNDRLLSVLMEAIPGLSRAYVINWIPEQDVDIYTVVVDRGLVVTTEISRIKNAAEVLVDVCDFAEYRKKNPSLSKERRRKLEVALELARVAPSNRA